MGNGKGDQNIYQNILCTNTTVDLINNVKLLIKNDMGKLQRFRILFTNIPKIVKIYTHDFTLVNRRTLHYELMQSSILDKPVTRLEGNFLWKIM